MNIRLWAVTLDCRDIVAQSRWWGEVLDWAIIYEADNEVVLVPPHALDETRHIPIGERGPGMIFVPVPEDKTVKNRLHLDLAPPADRDHAEEVARLEAMGATRVDVGQDEAKVSWTVLADPEGNEFCVLSSRDD